MLGTCYLLAALAALASGPEENIKNLIDDRHADIGLYGVKLFVHGHWITVSLEYALLALRHTASVYGRLSHSAHNWLCVVCVWGGNL